MLIGHYSAAFVAKKWAPTGPLWLYFVAAQFLDAIFFGLTLTGTEAYKITPPGFGPLSLDLHDHHVSHSLLGGIVWAGFFAACLLLVGRRGGGISAKVACAAGAVVFSHWLLDLVVHVDDLPLWPFPGNGGWGIWQFKHLSMLLECVMAAAAFFWLFGTRLGIHGWYLFGVLIFSELVYTYLLPLPETPLYFALLAWFVMAAHGLAALRAAREAGIDPKPAENPPVTK